ncbi:MAG: Ig-like domain-containing protein, partial [Rhizobiaceae bacterium]
TVTINADGTVKYTPNTGFVGQDTFTYTITDDKGATDTATVTIDVKAPANTTDAVNDASDATKDKPQEIDVLANDTDAEGDDFKVTDTTDGLNGTVKILPNGKVEYTPNTGFVGTDIFTYTITDDKGATDTATVTVTVKDDVPANSVDAVDDAAVAEMDKPQEIDVLSNDTDPEGDTFTVTDVTNGANGTVKILPNGKVEYTPNAGFTGSDTFTYTVTDANGATDTATVTVDVKDTAPANSVDAVDDVANAAYDTPVKINVLSNDSDPEGDAFTVTSVTDGQGGTVTIAADGQVIYTPNPGVYGVDTFTYTITDAKGATSTATVSVTIEGPTDPANSVVAVDDTAVAAHDTPVKIDVVGNDTDPEGDAFTVTSVTDGQGGSVTIAADGQVIYTPNPGVYGVDTFTYTITDAKGATSTATVSVTIEGPTDPTNSVDAVKDIAWAVEDTPVTIDVVANDSDPEGDYFEVTSVTNGQGGTVSIAADGQVLYTPNAGFVGEDVFTYTITDSKGATSTAEVCVTVEASGEPAGPDCGEPTVVGTDATDFLYGTAGNDVIQAGGGNDVIYTSAGDDCIDGGEGFDQVVYQGCTTDYAFTQNEDGSVTATANDGSGVDLLMDIEGIYFEETCEWFTVDDLC